MTCPVRWALSPLPGGSPDCAWWPVDGEVFAAHLLSGDDRFRARCGHLLPWGVVVEAPALPAGARKCPSCEACLLLELDGPGRFRRDWQRPADHVISFTVTPADLASALYPDMGRAHAAEALATVRLLQWCERAAMQALGGTPAGRRIEIDHRAPAVCGARVTVAVWCVDRVGARSAWRVVAHDGVEEIARGSMRFVQLDARFAARLAAKQEGSR